MNTNSLSVFVTVIFVLVFSYAPPRCAAAEGDTPIAIMLSGNASGGDLTLLRLDYATFLMATVQTQENEPLEQIARKLSEAAVVSHISKEARVDGNKFYLPRGAYNLVGTEIGIRRGTLPASVTLRYDASRDTLYAYWDPTKATSGTFRAWWKRVDCAAGEASLEDFSKALRHNFLTGREEVPSPHDALFMCDNRNNDGSILDPCPRLYIHFQYGVQEEITNTPFVGGVFLGWLPWFREGFESRDLVLCEGHKDTVSLDLRRRRWAISPEDRYVFQEFGTARNLGGPGGIYRQFLGLTPGHTYRVGVRLNTFGAVTDKGNWSFSFHATPDSSGRKTLTPGQLAGTEPLPDGSKGQEAGQVARFGTGSVGTSGSWQMVGTGTDNPGKVIGDIQVPEGCDSISVWLRLTGDCDTRVGMDWIRFEDLTPWLREGT